MISVRFITSNILVLGITLVGSPFIATSSRTLANPVTKPNPVVTPANSPQSQPSPVPTDLRPLTLNTSLLSLQGGRRLINEAGTAVSAQNYDLAAKRLQDARQVFNQLSNFYQDLASSFAGVDNRVANEHRQKALDSAQLRDQATYQLALVHRAQNQPELAVPLLIQIIRSQQPGRELGQKAYQQLLELGFADTPYPRNDAPTPAVTPSK